MPDLISNGVALFLAWLLGQAAVHKFRSTLYYQGLLGQYLTLGASTNPLVYLAGVVELMIAVSLVLPLTRDIGLAAACAVLLGYAGMMALQWLRGKRHTRCGCAGPGSALNISPALVLRNLVCCTLAWASIMPVTTVAPMMLAWVFSLLVAAFLVVIYLCVEQLIANGQLMAEAR